MKDKPDFSNCRDSEFAEIEWEIKQCCLDNLRPFLKILKNLGLLKTENQTESKVEGLEES